MSTFTAELPTTKPLDPSKRMRYTAGLVLGVDDFTQEQTYHIARDRLHQRLLHGYGTVTGLQITQRQTDKGPEVVVSAGAAVDPRGHLVCVRTAQCARINAWLQANHDDVSRSAVGSPDTTSIYVVLRYRTCEVDWVPVPGGPCRMQDDTRTASRLMDSFELALTLRRPQQAEEDAVRRLEQLIAAIEITSGGGVHSSDADVAAAVRSLTGSVTSPPGASLRFHTATAHDRMRTLYRTWATDVRPVLVPNSEGGCAEPAEEWLQLARLTFALDALGNVSGPIAVNETERPILAHTRAIQERW